VHPHYPKTGQEADFPQNGAAKLNKFFFKTAKMAEKFIFQLFFCPSQKNSLISNSLFFIKELAGLKCSFLNSKIPSQ
jgi:hypothetical protein